MTKQNDHDAHIALIDSDAPINNGIRHADHMEPPPLQIPWQVVAALLIMCIGLAGYAVAIFKN